MKSAHDKIRHQEKQRQRAKQDIEAQRREINEKGASGLREFGAGSSDALEQAFKTQTVGLVSRDEFLEKRQYVSDVLDEDSKKRRAEEEAAEAENIEKAKKMLAMRKKKSKLSFIEEEEDEEDGETLLAPRPTSILGKDPAVRTDFLPDREREKEEERLREKLKKEWVAKQERIKAEPLDITYSYWNGVGHRRRVTVKKGDTVGTFLRAVQEQLAPSFRELKAASSSSLMYVKEDVILPNTITFYELITKKARGKSGPLFQFDLQEHAVAQFDPRLKSQDSHAGKVVERHWYSSNKHIYPYSKWETYDEQKHIPSESKQ